MMRKLLNNRLVQTMDIKVSAADVAKNFGQFADKALSEPVTITKYGREDLVLLSASEYARLKSRDRRVYHVSEVPDDLLAAIEATEPPAAADAVERELNSKAR
jgi:prevent-host-death family protein